MTSWTERILQAFPEDLSPFWIASDPDNLLLDERIPVSYTHLTLPTNREV